MSCLGERPGRPLLRPAMWATVNEERKRASGQHLVMRPPSSTFVLAVVEVVADLGG